MDASVTRTQHQTLVHLSAAQAERQGASSSEPVGRHRDARAPARIEERLGKLRAARLRHTPGYAQPLEVIQAFRRDEFAAQLGARKLLLLGEQHARAPPGEVNSRARTSRAAPD